MGPRANDLVKLAYACDKCEKSYTMKSSLKGHQTTKHNKALPPKNVTETDINDELISSLNYSKFDEGNKEMSDISVDAKENETDDEDTDEVLVEALGNAEPLYLVEETKKELTMYHSQCIWRMV